LVAHYHNGTFVHTLASRVKTPYLRFDADGVDLVIDNTNYLAKEKIGGKVRPGSIFEYIIEDSWGMSLKYSGRYLEKMRRSAVSIVVKDRPGVSLLLRSHKSLLPKFEA
jgi:hypothetical protein